MIRKWTTTLSPHAKKRISKDWTWRKSKGLAKAVQLPSHLVSRLLASGTDKEDVLKEDEANWGAGLVKCFHIGWDEHQEFLNAFRRGRRMAAYIDGSVPEGGTEVTIMFYGVDENGQDASWKLTAVFAETGELGFLSSGGGSFPKHWMVNS